MTHDEAMALDPSALDARILAAIAAWHETGAPMSEAAFNALALDLYAHQLARNEPYRRYVLGEQRDPPRTWRHIVAVPSSAFKDATLATFPPSVAELEFHTSGTTQGRSGRHYMERAELYRRALIAGFDRFMLQDGAQLVYLNLLAHPSDNPRSSLSFMMGAVGLERGTEAPRFYVRDDVLDVEAFCRDLAACIDARRAVCVAGTAFAFASLLDDLDALRLRFRCVAGSRVMETGGFKGRTRAIDRATLYARVADAMGVAERDVVAEYGMTELTSQYYDSPASRGGDVRIKAGPPWLRTIVVDDDGREVPPGETGLLRHVDLANRSSVIAVATEDRGYAASDGFVLLGRSAGAPPRGCSLDAEDLAAVPR